MRFSFLALSTLLCLSVSAQKPAPVQIQVTPGTQIATVSKLFNGTNIEDLNNQTNGGVFSQLLHGEAFEENVDIDFLNLPVNDYVKVYVVLDEMRRPHFLSQANIYNRITWNNLSEKYDFNSKDIYSTLIPQRRGNQPPRPIRPDKIGPLKFYGRFMVYDSIPEAIRNELTQRINGDEQISRYWTKVADNGVKVQYKQIRGNAYMGRQDQLISYVGGSGEAGLTNAGLNKQGINLEAGKDYNGVLRLKSAQPATIYLSLRDRSGKILAEQPYQLSGNNTWEKLEFALTPNGSCPRGSFGITLKAPGEVRLGYAFMQPGEWGRVKGLPVRKMFIDALKKQGITVIRYNGSMVDVGADTYLYRWKKMIGPVDERRVTFRSGFNPYATHSFGLEDIAKVAEAFDATVIIGMSMDETAEDIRDFVEYMNGNVSTKWGKLRAEYGHPAPYNVKYIQVDNERGLDRGYAECMKKFATAAWKADPDMHIVASLNIGTREGSYARGSAQYALAHELMGWFIAQGQGDKFIWDPHYSGSIRFADHPRFTQEMGIDLQNELAKDFPDHKLVLTPMEENGSRCDWDRGLAHAHNWNTLQRYGNHFRFLGTANTFQPYKQNYMWDQGRIHYTTNEIWFQPSAYIDEKMVTDFLPDVVEATSSVDSLLDVTAKMSADRKTLAVMVVNLSDQPQASVINLGGFKQSGKANVWSIGDCDLTAWNTVEAKETVAPKVKNVSLNGKNIKYTFPRYSYTIITFKGK
ncbi:MAG: hypothetical protein LBN06_12185 [Prevotellaceae bacterium]|jgi:alpha-L-arabinofuranosidase|nr:hypothetical protein [Prevotellaceae bacterium]